MKKNTFNVILLFILVLGRIIPHPWNMTPTITLALFASRLYSPRQAIAITLLCFIFTDACLALLQHHNVWGSWSVFTYSALFAIAYTASAVRTKALPQTCALLLSCSMGYWLWTNFGCWLTMPEYSKNIAGLIQCYTMGLPFLKNQIAGDGLWLLATLAGHHAYQKRMIQSPSSS